MFRSRTVSTAAATLLTAALAALGACNDQRPTEPPTPIPQPVLEPLSGPRLVECRRDEPTSQTFVIDEDGGTAAIGGTSVAFPAGLLAGPTTITLTLPASRYVEVEIETSGATYFPVAPELRPVITIDYSHCSRTDILTKPLSAWYIDSETKELLEPMVGVDDKLLRRVTFPTNHFSGYAIAF